MSIDYNKVVLIVIGDLSSSSKVGPFYFQTTDDKNRFVDDIKKSIFKIHDQYDIDMAVDGP